MAEDTKAEESADSAAKTSTGDVNPAIQVQAKSGSADAAKNLPFASEEAKSATISGRSTEKVKSDDEARAKVVASELAGGVGASSPEDAAQAVADAHEHRIDAARELGSKDPPKPGPRVRERGEDPNQDDFEKNRIEQGRAKQGARAANYAGQAEDSDEPFQVTEPREARKVASTA